MTGNYLLKAPEYLFILAVLLAVSVYLNSILLSIISLVLFLALLFFFRAGPPIPLSQIKDKNIIMCPADGVILGIKEHPDKKLVQVAIFLNVHNVHVQYSPYSGTIVSQQHKPGSFKPAYAFEKSEHNERMETIILTDFGPIILVQIAGLVARRIVAFHKKGDQIVKGEPFGLIKFGSRVDVYCR